MKSPRRILTLLVCLLAGTAGIPHPAPAMTPATPMVVGTTNAQSATLGIPRWKGWIDPADPDRIWVTFANSSTVSNNLVVSGDGGLTWSSDLINPADSGYLNYHVGVAGRGDDLFLTFPANDGIQVRRFAAPASGPDDLGVLATMPATTPYHRSNVMVDGNGRVWCFTRRGDAPAENVRYHYSDDHGATWTSGVAVASGTPDVRFGSMPYIDGRACLVLLNLNSDRGYEYYLWDGSSFVAEPDYAILPVNVGYSRAFTHNVTADSTFHLVYALQGELHHRWKDFAGGTGQWRDEILATQPRMDDMEWAPILTVRGDELYLFTSEWQDSPADAQIYVRRWTPATGAWEPRALVSTGGLSYNVNPNTSFSVPESSPSIPVFWTAGAAGDMIRFNRLEVAAAPGDVTPPSQINDLKAATGFMSETVELAWTAPGDDADLGQAVSYEVRRSRVPLTPATWPAAVPVPGAPVPSEAGHAESMSVTALKTGALYYFGLVTFDDAGNASGISNIASVRVGSISAVDTPAADRARLLTNRPNPFNPSTIIPFSLPREGQVTVTLYDSAGRRVARLADAWYPAGTHEVRWNGRGDDGRAASSGTYFCRLDFAGTVATSRLTLLR